MASLLIILLLKLLHSFHLFLCTFFYFDIVSVRFYLFHFYFYFTNFSIIDHEIRGSWLSMERNKLCWTFCVWVKCKTLCHCLYSSPSCFSACDIWNFGIVNLCSWFKKSGNMADWGGEFSISQGNQVRFDIKFYISITIKPMITKFSKQVHLQGLTQMRLINQVLVTSSCHDHVTN